MASTATLEAAHEAAPMVLFDDGLDRTSYSLPYLRAWAAWAGVSILELSRRAGVSDRLLVYVISGAYGMRAGTLRKVAAALGVPPVVLITRAPTDPAVRSIANRIALDAARQRAEDPAWGRRERVRA